MSILERIKQDVNNLSIKSEIEQLRISLKDYMSMLNDTLQREGNVSFDYCDGCVSSYNYFDFSKDVVFVISNNHKSSSVLLTSRSFVAEFKFYPSNRSLITWDYSLLRHGARDEILNLIRLINDRIGELR